MESERKRKFTHRNPLYDRTNTSSSSSLPVKSTKPNLSTSPPSFKKPNSKRTSTTQITSSLDAPSNPSSPPSTFLSTPLPKTPSTHGIVDLEASEPISIVFSRKHFSNKRKEKGNEVVIPSSSAPVKRKDNKKEGGIPSSSTSISRVSNTRDKSDGFEGADLPKAKAWSVPCRKKQRAESSKQDLWEDPTLEDYIKKQNAYFKTIDEFELEEEEVDYNSDN